MIDKTQPCPLCERPMNKVHESEWICCNARCALWTSTLHPINIERLRKLPGNGKAE